MAAQPGPPSTDEYRIEQNRSDTDPSSTMKKAPDTRHQAAVTAVLFEEDEHTRMADGHDRHEPADARYGRGQYVAGPETAQPRPLRRDRSSPPTPIPAIPVRSFRPARSIRLLPCRFRQGCETREITT